MPPPADHTLPSRGASRETTWPRELAPLIQTSIIGYEWRTGARPWMAALMVPFG